MGEIKLRNIFLKIIIFSLIVFLTETIFFHIFNYIHGYFDATITISYVVLGAGMGAFFSNKIKISERQLFLLCLIGLILSLYLSAIKIIFFASTGLSNFILMFSFFFPAVYISKAYAEKETGSIYLFDMLGGLIGVFLTLFLYYFFFSETIFLLILLFLPILGLIFLFFEKINYKTIYVIIFTFFILIDSIFLYNQIVSDKYNIFNLINCKNIDNSPEGTKKIFCRDIYFVKNYDNLAGRIDITKPDSKSTNYTVSYDGWPNDVFHRNIISTDNDYLNNITKEWPTLDIRFLYGIKKEPKVLIIGSAAQGIIPTIRKITPLEKLKLIEINPSVIEIMRNDFFEESGRAYVGLNPILGNGVSFLKKNNEKFDIITMMNVHPYRNIGHYGAPDYLHTFENYKNIFKDLSEEGYLMIEERPETKNSRLALYRQINTLWKTLEENGAQNPSDHFLIWSWMYGDREINKYNLYYFTGIAVFKNPIKKEWISPWVEKQLSRKQFNLEYSNFYQEKINSEEFFSLFQKIESNNFDSLIKEGFDHKIVKDNRPFLSQSIDSTNRLEKLVFGIGITSLFLLLILTAPLLRKKRRGIITMMSFYHILIAFAFFSIQIIIFQVYQNIFLSPSFSFVLILGFLLIFSGIGGYFSNRLNLKIITPLLAIFLILSIFFPKFSFVYEKLPYLSNFLSLVFVSITGFLMGSYFPKGLNFIKEISLQKEVYNFYAIDAVVSSFTVPLTLLLGIKFGYFFVIVISIFSYILAFIILNFCLSFSFKEKLNNQKNVAI